MFIIRFLRWLFGWAEFEAEGGFPERLLNLAARGGVTLWNTGRHGASLQACCMCAGGTACPFLRIGTGHGQG